MRKLSLHHCLGQQLRHIRKARGLSQSELAALVNLSIPTIRLLEHGQGNLSSLWQVLAALHVEVTGRQLPTGHTMGAQLATLRKRKGLSQRALAALLGITPPTLIALEKHSRGRLQTLKQVCTILGAGISLAPQGSPKNFYTHAGNSSSSHHWETPPALLEPLYRVFGRFDLDPCSPTHYGRRAPVQATVYYTADDDGLSLPWFGTVFLNPPYGRSLSHWTAKAKAEVAHGNAHVVVALLPARPDTAYWHRDLAGSAQIFFLRGRLRFGNAAQSAPFPSCLAVWGASPEVVAKLQTTLPTAWLSQ